jgi:hypothetical protein
VHTIIAHPRASIDRASEGARHLPEANRLSERGRNDPCYCGSGLKLKKCCLAKFYGAGRQGEAALPLHDRNLLLIEAIYNIFGLPQTPSPTDLAGKFSNAKIKAFYEFIDQLWPPETDVYALLPDVGDSFTAYFVGEARPNELLQNVLRLSLYADRIFVLDPFTKSWHVKPEFRPVLRPEDYQYVTLRLVLWVLALEPWIRTGVVTIIPDPFEFDGTFASYALDLAESRGLPTMDPRDMARLTKHQQDEMFGFWITLPESYLESRAREMGFDDSEIAGIMSYRAKVVRLSPFPDNLPSDEKRGQLFQLDIGGPIEDAMLICQLTGAFPYADLYNRRDQLARFAASPPTEADIWTPLSSAFTELPFSFLNNVNVRYIEELRHEDRPSMMRGYLRKLWRQVAGESQATESIVADFTEELAEQYRIAREQWEEIETKSSGDLWKTGIGTVAATLLLDTQAPLVAGHLAPIIPAAGFAATSLASWWQERGRRRSFKRNVPMSIFVELNKQ